MSTLLIYFILKTAPTCGAFTEVYAGWNVFVTAASLFDLQVAGVPASDPTYAEGFGYFFVGVG